MRKTQLLPDQDCLSSRTETSRLQLAPSGSRRWFGAALDVFFPPQCKLCSILASDGLHDGLCQTCEEDFPSFSTSTCPRCSRPLGEHVDSKNCPDCVRFNYRFRRTFAIGSYTDGLRDLIHGAKYKKSISSAIILGQRLATHLEPIDLAGFVVVSVPMHWWGRLRRTYNQADIIASVLARRLKLSYIPQWLKQVRSTPSQVGLTAGQRQVNVQGSFALARRARVKGRRILLVDDVMTTGATCNEATRVLLKGGARQVWVATAARALSHESIKNQS